MKDNKETLENGWHLAKTPLEAATTEVEWALLRWYKAHFRFVAHVMSQIGLPSMGIEDMYILNIVGLHDRPKSAQMIANLLNRDDIQNVQYSLRKLMAAGLIEKHKDSTGKNANVTATAHGRQVCDQFAAIRSRWLITQLEQIENCEARLLLSAKTVSVLTGLYDEAGRTSIAGVAEPLLDQ